MKITKAALDKKYEKIAKLNDRLAALNAQSLDMHHDNEIGYVFDAENSVRIDEMALISSLINMEKNSIAQAEVIDNSLAAENTVTFGDQVTLLLQYSDGEILTRALLLMKLHLYIKIHHIMTGKGYLWQNGW